jgi:cyclohexanone monooxygenase
MRERASRTLFTHNGCQTANSYYFDRNGDLTFLRLEGFADALAAQDTFPLDDYEFSSRVPATLAHR